jgi:hypothetical protein
MSKGSSETTTIVRIVMRGQSPASSHAEERILLDAFGDRWPKGVHAKFVLTPGGFVRGAWPPSWRGQLGWNSRSRDIKPLFSEAQRQLAAVVTERVYQAASGKADVLTIGIDLGDSEHTHAELVAVCDIAKRKVFRWTGKSYPISSQERRLVQVTDLDTHFMEIAGERVVVLGCHDLNMFSPRGRANQRCGSHRRTRCNAMKHEVEDFKPTIVLQHPHSTDSQRIWRMPWLALAGEAQSVRAWASGIAYYRPGNAARCRSPLDKVLSSTRSSPEDVKDIIFRSSNYS